MKPHPRIRKTVKWGGLALTVVLVVVWIASRWYGLGWQSGSGGGAWLINGGLAVTLGGVSDPYGSTLIVLERRGWIFLEHPPLTLVRPFFDERNGGFSRSSLPLWMPILALMAPTGVAWRLDVLAHRRRLVARCGKCQYDRTGLAAEAPCPECGTPPVLSAGASGRSRG